ncbi:MAG: hypothetical protein JWO62_3318 [Acidimicrobiaceae bacterium]|jgi:hypothetical protein|nr:hypothetical protein [Acidimicrobiaceae bacterium]
MPVLRSLRSQSDERSGALRDASRPRRGTRAPTAVAAGAALAGALLLAGTASATAVTATAGMATAGKSSDHGGFSFLGRFSTVSVGPSTVPANGDLNPYGVAVVDHSEGDLVAGDTLVSNFNDAANAQGTGTTIVQVSATGTSLFSQLDAASLPGACPGGIGLTTALAVLPGGWVVVGSLPTVGGNPGTMQAGCLIVLDSDGQPVETISGGAINGPWDLAAVAKGGHAELFVTNVLNGTVAAAGADPTTAPGTVVPGGTVVRIGLRLDHHEAPTVTSETVIASGFPERTDPSALVIGPTGIAVGHDGDVYVADTLGNRIAKVPNGFRRSQAAANGADTLSSGGLLDGPLGMTLAPNGDVLTTNAGNGNIVETTPAGRQVASAQLDSSGSPAGAGALFGLAVAPHGNGVIFVDDATNTLDLFH